jgi:hypothetical protein
MAFASAGTAAMATLWQPGIPSMIESAMNTNTQEFPVWQQREPIPEPAAGALMVCEPFR